MMLKKKKKQNVLNSRLPYLNEDPDSLLEEFITPLPKHHVLMGVVTKLALL